MDEKTIGLLERLRKDARMSKSRVWAKNDMMCALADAIKAMASLPDDDGLDALSKDSEYGVYGAVANLLVDLGCVMDAYGMEPGLLNWILKEKLDFSH